MKESQFRGYILNLTVFVSVIYFVTHFTVMPLIISRWIVSAKNSTKIRVKQTFCETDRQRDTIMPILNIISELLILIVC